MDRKFRFMYVTSSAMKITTELSALSNISAIYSKINYFQIFFINFPLSVFLFVDVCLGISWISALLRTNQAESNQSYSIFLLVLGPFFRRFLTFFYFYFSFSFRRSASSSSFERWLCLLDFYLYSFREQIDNI